jgi:Icc-related predicted phosphoesterase
MKIVALTDIHGNISAIERLASPLADADVVLLTGDLTHFGGAEDAARVLAAVRDCSRRVYAVAGNCDRPEVAEWLELEGISLHGRHEVIDGVAFLGLGGSLPSPGMRCNEFSDAELAGFLDAAAEGLDPALPWLLVSHQPPADTTLDVVRNGMHVGSAAVRCFIERHRPLACFTGHIHEAAGTDSIGQTCMANPGPARGGGYTYAEVAERLEVLEIRQVPRRQDDDSQS